MPGGSGPLGRRGPAAGPRTPENEPPEEGRPPRLARLRRHPGLRELFAESRITLPRLVQPLYVLPGAAESEEVAGLPFALRRNRQEAARFAGEVYDAGLRAVLVYGSSAQRDPSARAAYAAEGPVPRTIREIKQYWPELVVIADVCVCAYTDDGSCLLRQKGRPDLVATVAAVQRAAVAYAAAGADLVAPSAAVDHLVGEVRDALDAAGKEDTGIVGRGARFLSALERTDRAGQGLRGHTQRSLEHRLDGRNGREAERAMARDASEGADLLSVEPAVLGLDLLAWARRQFAHPILAIQSLGEAALVHAGAARHLADREAIIEEGLAAIRRAGADLIATPFALEMARSEAGQGEG